MNKLMAMFFFIGTIGFFSLSMRSSYHAQNQSRLGAPVGEVRTIPISRGDKYCFTVLGVGCMVASFCFLANSRKDGLK